MASLSLSLHLESLSLSLYLESVDDAAAQFVLPPKTILSSLHMRLLSINDIVAYILRLSRGSLCAMAGRGPEDPYRPRESFLNVGWWDCEHRIRPLHVDACRWTKPYSNLWLLTNCIRHGPLQSRWQESQRATVKDSNQIHNVWQVHRTRRNNISSLYPFFSCPFGLFHAGPMSWEINFRIGHKI